jgi:RNA polymerase sigma-70 factor (ECF subfamily)
MMRSSIPVTVAVAEGGSSMAESSPLHQRMDEAAFQDFYSEIAPRLWAYIRRAASDAALADDILQETFHRFLRAELPALERHQLKAYLYRTASSLLADHWRRLKRERRWSLESFFGAKPAAGPERGGDALRLFERLKPQEQALLWLAYVEGFDHREVASALEVREKSVRVLLFRARKKLASLLTNQGIGREAQS